MRNMKSESWEFYPDGDGGYTDARAEFKFSAVTVNIWGKSDKFETLCIDDVELQECDLNNIAFPDGERWVTAYEAWEYFKEKYCDREEEQRKEDKSWSDHEADLSSLTMTGRI